VTRTRPAEARPPKFVKLVAVCAPGSPRGSTFPSRQRRNSPLGWAAESPVPAIKRPPGVIAKATVHVPPAASGSALKPRP